MFFFFTACELGYSYVNEIPGRCQDNGCPQFASGAPSACACDSGYFGSLTAPVDSGNWTGSCDPCAPIENGSGAITCSSGANSRAGANFVCNTGYLLDTTGDADVCAAQSCPALSAANADKSACVCDSGYFGTVAWTATGYSEITPCTVCSPIDNALDASAPVTCSASGKSFAVDPAAFKCKDGYVFVQDPTNGDSCAAVACPAHADNSADPNTCVCLPGFYGSLTETGNTFNGDCNPCASILYSTGSVTCTDASNSVAGNGFACDSGFVYSAPSGSKTAGTCEVQSVLSGVVTDALVQTVASALTSNVQAATGESTTVVERVHPVVKVYYLFVFIYQITLCT